MKQFSFLLLYNHHYSPVLPKDVELIDLLHRMFHLPSNADINMSWGSWSKLWLVFKFLCLVTGSPWHCRSLATATDHLANIPDWNPLTTWLSHTRLSFHLMSTSEVGLPHSLLLTSLGFQVDVDPIVSWPHHLAARSRIDSWRGEAGRSPHWIVGVPPGNSSAE